VPPSPATLQRFNAFLGWRLPRRPPRRPLACVRSPRRVPRLAPRRLLVRVVLLRAEPLPHRRHFNASILSSPLLRLASSLCSFFGVVRARRRLRARALPATPPGRRLRCAFLLVLLRVLSRCPQRSLRRLLPPHSAVLQLLLRGVVMPLLFPLLNPLRHQ